VGRSRNFFSAIFFSQAKSTSIDRFLGGGVGPKKNHTHSPEKKNSESDLRESVSFFNSKFSLGRHNSSHH